ncbi:hypothetical protein PTTG_27218 [Puccinia triticina 1-1 BBBD Race 1]|uniref:Uncharacterized protein n=1 Tax=Puccinia triticina (isolate 1-1 / race 1 (BBBD)) TaxID=630390 RepID=A0A180GLW9_PUCT1|nr:hypothetical protein PTTG_27218 [Puccinia triticina 1-1 BBBD Race 1]
MPVLPSTHPELLALAKLLAWKNKRFPRAIVSTSSSVPSSTPSPVLPSTHPELLALTSHPFSSRCLPGRTNALRGPLSAPAHPCRPRHPAQSRQRHPCPGTHPELLAPTKPSGQFKLLARKNKRSPRAIVICCQHQRPSCSSSSLSAPARSGCWPSPSTVKLFLSNLQLIANHYHPSRPPPPRIADTVQKKM